MTDSSINLKQYLREVPDWPKPGILFYDVAPLLGSKEALKVAIESLAAGWAERKIDYVAATEARGFIFGTAVAKELGVGFVPIRKKGKLPYKTVSCEYDLEYGSDTLEVHVDAVEKGAKVLMLDDLLATGGTMATACKLIEKIGGDIIGLSFLIELSELKGREKLGDYDIHTIITY